MKRNEPTGLCALSGLRLTSESSGEFAVNIAQSGAAGKRKVVSGLVLLSEKPEAEPNRGGASGQGLGALGQLVKFYNPKEPKKGEQYDL